MDSSILIVWLHRERSSSYYQPCSHGRWHPVTVQPSPQDSSSLRLYKVSTLNTVFNEHGHCWLDHRFKRFSWVSARVFNFCSKKVETLFHLFKHSLPVLKLLALSGIVLASVIVSVACCATQWICRPNSSIFPYFSKRSSLPCFCVFCPLFNFIKFNKLSYIQILYSKFP